MKTTNKLAIALVTAFTIFVGCAFIPGCLGVKARDTAGVATLDTAADGMKADCMAGIATLPAEWQTEATNDVNAFFTAIDSKDRTTIAAMAAPVWPQIKTLAEAGIAAQVASGDIGVNGSKSLQKRVDEFEKVLSKVVERLE